MYAAVGSGILPRFYPGVAMDEPLRLLLAEDSPDDAALLEATLRSGGFAPEIHRVTTEAGFRAALRLKSWDVVVLDYTLPEFSAHRALAILREETSSLRALVVSGTVGEDALVATLRAGAADYIQKQNLSRLVPAVRRELQDARQRCERQTAERALLESEERFRFVLDHAGGVLYRLRYADMQYEYMSAGIETLTGYTASELREVGFDSLITLVTEPADMARAGVARKDFRMALFALIGTTYGGDGRTMFALPDLRAVAPNNMTYSICVEGIFPAAG